MKVTFKIQAGVYEQEIDKVQCSNPNSIRFYAGGWSHPVIIYDIEERSIRIYDTRECIDCHRVINGITDMVIE